MAGALAPEVLPFSSEEIGIKNSVWGQKSVDKEVGFQPTLGERAKQNFWTEDNRRLSARFNRTLLARKRKESAK